ncbi:phosphoglycerate dehydrogenase [Breznakiella homolactica]|uniref:Phosphoglycerate dehydrogenase n=1 Tax=Breznakiella homolactica TaxID=2798577 RepID=A0A7T8BB15_9SPIR|nr:phosphoglycerate dehydrogenase [Breznakiella homolactica]QQO09575.1 phosphoglycerate dehydrogenase [Breznakiella homolactica]
MKRKVLITQPWPASYVTEFDRMIESLEAKGFTVMLHPKEIDMPEEEVLQFPDDLYAVVCGSDRWTARAMDRIPSLKVISRIGVGYDSVDVKAATERKIAVLTTPGAHSHIVAEAALAMMLAVGRQMIQGDYKVRHGWEKVIGPSVYGKTLGIIGLGDIGKWLVRLVQGFRMRVVAYDPFPDMDFAGEHGITFLPLDDLLRESDFISIHTALTDETRGMIGERAFGLMKPLSVLINCARGGLIDEAALYHALKERKIFGAGLDVFDKEPLPPTSPLLELDNLLLAPHNAGTSYEGKNAVVGAAIQNLIRFADGEHPKGFRNPEILEKKI